MKNTLFILFITLSVCFAGISMDYMLSFTIYGTDKQGNIHIAKVSCNSFFTISCEIKESTIKINKNGSCEFEYGSKSEGIQDYKEPDSTNIDLDKFVDDLDKYTLSYSLTEQNGAKKVNKIFFSKNSNVRYEIDFEKMIIVNHEDKITYDKKSIENKCKSFVSDVQD